MTHTGIKFLKKHIDEMAIFTCMANIAFTPGFEINQDDQLILAALRRSSEEFKFLNVQDIGNTLSRYNSDQINGLVSNVKGIAHEMEYVRIENDDGDAITATLYTDTNHPGYDVQLYDEDSGESWDVQLKATDSSSYVNQWIEQHPEGDILVTDELAKKLDLESSSISNNEITVKVEDFVEKLIHHNDAVSLAHYFPALTLMSVSVVIWELWKRYQSDHISYSKFKRLAGLAAGKKTLKIGALVILLSIPGVNVAVGAALIAHFIYSSSEWISTKTTRP